MNNHLDKLMRFCLYRERCIMEVQQKMETIQVPGNKRSKLLDSLIDNGYLSEERFVKAFVNTKVYVKRWGKNKIKFELQMKHIPSELIEKEILGIDEDIYNENFEKVYNSKLLELKGRNKSNTRDSLYRYLTGKGYEVDLILQKLGQLKE